MFRILVVDDDPSVLACKKLMIEFAGHTPTIANNGPQALTYFKEQKFDLVVTDMTMPDMDGIDLITRLRSISPAIPVILSSGDPTCHLKLPKDLKDLHLLQKPYQYSSFLELIRVALQQTQ